jgi:murein DD-endopeptidase MepM/ murein hydrolase activator NlpD
MARQRYYYNPETCKYEPVVLSGKEFMRSTSVFLAISFIIGLIGLIYFNMKFPLWDEMLLREKNQQLKTEWQTIYQDLNKTSSELSHLESNDDENYRAILDLNPLSVEERQAGAGGREREYASLDYNLIRVAYEQVNKILNRISVEKQSYDQLHKEFDGKEKMWASRPAIQPIDNKDLTRLHTTYGMRQHPLLGYVRPHRGLDFTAPKNSPVYATGDGRVMNAEYSSSYGNVIYINHGFSFETRYAHLTRFIVKAGEKVKRGQVIGYVGSTGLSGGSHLHYEILYKGDQINPINFFQRDLNNKEYEKLIELGGKSVSSLD